MMISILAPTDFSTASLNAVNYAADLALSINARLALFHAIPLPIAISEISVPEDFIEEMTETGKANLDALEKKINIRTKGKLLISKNVKMGTVELEIENIASLEQPLAIVIGINPKKTLETAFMGSSVFHMMNYNEFPTLLIPATVDFVPFREIGIALDLSKGDYSSAFRTIKRWLALFKAKLSIVNITGTHKDFDTVKFSESIFAEHQLHAFNPQFHFLTGKHIAAELNEFEITHRLDLLIVIPKNYGLLQLFHRSMSKKLTANNHLLILSIHQQHWAGKI